jgi:hypothetical protein
MKVLGIEVLRWECNETGSAMVGKVQEHSIVLSRLEDTSTSDSSRISTEDGEIVLWSYILSRVVDNTPNIHIITLCGSGLIVQGPTQGVLRTIHGIIVRKHDDVLGLVPVTHQDLVGVACVGLVTVVPEAIGAGHEDGELLGTHACRK